MIHSNQETDSQQIDREESSHTHHPHKSSTHHHNSHHHRHDDYAAEPIERNTNSPFHHSPVHTPHLASHAASKHFAPFHFPSDHQSHSASNNHSPTHSATQSPHDSAPAIGDRYEDIPMLNDKGEATEQPKHVSMPVISEQAETPKAPLQILVEDTSSLNRSRTNLNKSVGYALKPQSSPSLYTIAKEKPRISLTSLHKDTLSVHSATSILQKKKKIENARKKRTRFLYFAFILSLLASILWLIVFCSNGWFSRNFTSKKYFDFVHSERSKRNIENPKNTQLYNHKQNINNSLGYSNKKKTFPKTKTRSLGEMQKLTLSSQYGGVWRMCTSYVEVAESKCVFLEHYPSEEALKKRMNSNDVITFRRACAAMGIICIAIIVLSNAFIYYSILQHRYVYKRLSGSLLIGAAACILVCIEIFQGLLAKEQDQIYPQTSASLGVCYMLAWLCMGMLLISAGIIFFYSRKQKYDSMDDRPVIIGRI